ncbi:MAG: tRNA (adenosine(37)-N6)-threonylcarbamoyltransferase complex dimerization subunit type 1 TsaB [gamma proteobacterium symbiont of Taylorina sp.]|nr:tRNA (adenosine(37)-N6)-threonylcarbamoyltransferase complex dimerization subunit type 1 TsaB [gamma proteobacterium symbiont of Taylorina sp.]
MKILALETSTNACSVALVDGQQQDYSCIERFEIAPRKHTQLILPMIDSVLKEVGLDISQIDTLAFGRGPGAFTGVRIGIGVIQALSYGAGIPVAQISSLAAIAQRAYNQTNIQTQQQTKKILVASDARMKEIYFSAYEPLHESMMYIGSEVVMKPENLVEFLVQQSIVIDKQCIIVGSGWSEYSQQLSQISVQCSMAMFDDSPSNDNGIYPHAADIAFLAFEEIKNQCLVSAENVTPVYLRNNVAKKRTINIK